MCVTCKVALDESQSPQADREREYILSLIDEGKDEAEIKRSLVAQYGPTVLGLPSAHGFDLAVYLVPLAVVLALLTTILLLIPKLATSHPCARRCGRGLKRGDAAPTPRAWSRSRALRLTRFYSATSAPAPTRRAGPGSARSCGRGDAQRDAEGLERLRLDTDDVAVAVERGELLRERQRVRGDPVRRTPLGGLRELGGERQQPLHERTLGGVQRLALALADGGAHRATRSGAGARASTRSARTRTARSTRGSPAVASPASGSSSTVVSCERASRYHRAASTPTPSTSRRASRPPSRFDIASAHRAPIRWTSWMLSARSRRLPPSASYTAFIRGS